MDTQQIQETGPDVIVLKFADSAVPIFKESRGKDYIDYGEDNKYPDYLTHLFDKSSKHGAIIAGKAAYVFGKGFENGEMVVNRLGESLNDVTKKCALDIEIYGGYRTEVVYNMRGVITEIYHVDFTTIRLAKDGGFYFSEDWNKYTRKDNMTYIPAFNPSKPFGTQIYAYNEYRPKVRYYPLPQYIGSNNYIETDIEISKFYLSSIRNGMMPSKMIQFYDGEPSEDKKKAIENRFKKKFGGSENAGNFILVFNKQKDKQVDVSDLSATELDKMFIELNKTTQQEIFSGHRVTSPMLFGIKTEGQLGGNTELKAAYELFINTYAAPKSQAISKEFTYVLGYSNFKGEYKLMSTDPIGLQFDIKDVIADIPKEFILEKLGIPKELWGNLPGSTQAPAVATSANDNVKNLSAKQYQQLMRIIRDYGKGRITEAAARTMLKTSLNLGDEEINSILGVEAVATMSSQKEEDIISVFDGFGESKNDFEIIKSKKVNFSEEEAGADEEIYIQEAFKKFEVTLTEKRILDLIKKDSKITAEVISEAIGETKSFVNKKISSLIKRGYLESKVVSVGADEVVEHFIPENADISAPPPKKNSPTEISIKYSYEVKPGVGPAIIETSRLFCRKLIALNRLYSRADIEKISQRLGYSVFERKGGWWGDNPECRHLWKSNVVVRKNSNE